MAALKEYREKTGVRLTKLGSSKTKFPDPVYSSVNQNQKISLTSKFLIQDFHAVSQRYNTLQNVFFRKFDTLFICRHF